MGLFRKEENKWKRTEDKTTEEIRRRRLEKATDEHGWYFRLLEDVKKIQKAGGIPSSNPNLDLTIQLNRIIELLEKISRTTSKSESTLNDINDKTRDKYGDSHR